jgi:hypothetical protein
VPAGASFAIYVACESVEGLVPEVALIGQPALDVPGGVGFEGANMGAAFQCSRDEASLFQHPQMLADRRERHAKRNGELADRSRPLPEPAKNRAAGGIGQGAEGRVQAAFGVPANQCA